MSIFKNNIKKVKEKRIHSITNSYGIKDAYMYYKNSNFTSKEYSLKETDFRKLIKDVNYLVTKDLISTGYFNLPADIGSLRVYKKEVKPVIRAGKIYYNAPIDWKKTLELWENDNESKIAKTLVRVSPGPIYSIRYKNKFCKFKNKDYYIFKINRTLKALIKDKINNKESIPFYK